ncbi:hypothetical protein GIB67_024490 [Kingdonia uniflora]|uniref:Uncharacterized protein n=1 Tax=Kingdonia uniflora TaxID=39325 RepID=A0A7J7LNQ4_9MAGN|nr:hypothetical protein GIB67_024490 [Kingdonia uniflora]
MWPFNGAPLLLDIIPDADDADFAWSCVSDCPSSSKDSRREFVKDKRLQIASDDDKKINGEDDRCTHHADEDQNYQNIQEKLVGEDGENSEEEGEFNPDKHIDRPLDSHDNPDNGNCILSHHPFVEKGECSKENLLESVDKSDWAENNSQPQTCKGNIDRHRDLKSRRSVFDDEGSSDKDSEIVKDDQDSKQRKRKLIMSDVSDEEEGEDRHLQIHLDVPLPISRINKEQFLPDEYKKLEVLAFEMETTIASLEEDLARTNKEKEEILLRNKVLTSDVEVIYYRLSTKNSELKKLEQEVSSMLLTNALLELVEEKAIWIA